MDEHIEQEENTAYEHFNGNSLLIPHDGMLTARIPGSALYSTPTTSIAMA